MYGRARWGKCRVWASEQRGLNEGGWGGGAAGRGADSWRECCYWRYGKRLFANSVDDGGGGGRLEEGRVTVPLRALTNYLQCLRGYGICQKSLPGMWWECCCSPSSGSIAWDVRWLPVRLRSLALPGLGRGVSWP